MKQLLSFLMVMFIMENARSQQTIPLYPDAIPHSRTAPDEEKSEQRSNGILMVSKISRPTLSIFMPPKNKANGTAIIIFPGGAYWFNAMSHEGTDVARKFSEMGFTTFVVKYRIPDDATMERRETGPLQDAQQAISTVRRRAPEWNIDPSRIGIMGFSAGGHLASTAGTHFNTPVVPNADGISLRPDFMILIYPVISFQDNICHKGSREQLLGKTPSKEKIDLYSNELQVTAQTPPSFLVHASDDDGVDPENSIVFYQSLIRNKVPAELHLYQNGKHGFGMNNPTTDDDWTERCKHWLKANGWMNEIN